MGTGAKGRASFRSCVPRRRWGWSWCRRQGQKSRLVDGSRQRKKMADRWGRVGVRTKVENVGVQCPVLRYKSISTRAPHIGPLGAADAKFGVQPRPPNFFWRRRARVIYPALSVETQFLGRQSGVPAGGEKQAGQHCR
jgi:hypothetical protein